MSVNGSAMEPETAAPMTLNLVEEINHRVVNEFAEAIASLSIAASRSGDSRLKDELARVAQRLRDHANAHRALMPPRATGIANLADYAENICGSFARSTLENSEVHLALETADVLLPADRCWRIGLIVAELVRNAARHGRFGPEGRITVHIAEHAGEVRCLVRDTGAPPSRPVPGRGQALIQSLADDLGGTVEWSFTAEGCLALLRVPVDEAGGKPTLSLIDAEAD